MMYSKKKKYLHVDKLCSNLKSIEVIFVFKQNQQQRCLYNDSHQSSFHSFSIKHVPQWTHIKLLRQNVKAIHRKYWKDFSCPFKMVTKRQQE